MALMGDLGDIIDKAEAERFVGREHEIESFRQYINRTPPTYIIFYITGQGGVSLCPFKGASSPTRGRFSCYIGNDFILPVLPVQGFWQEVWERYKLKLTSYI
jgi:hypothetical protein